MRSRRVTMLKLRFISFTQSHIKGSGFTHKRRAYVCNREFLGIYDIG